MASSSNSHSPDPGRPRDAVERYVENRLKRLKIVTTTTSPSGQIIDWIPIESQVADGQIATPPPAPATTRPKGMRAVTFSLNGVAAERGPVGTVPVVRPNLSLVHASRTLRDYLSKRSSRSQNRQRAPLSADPGPDLSGYFHAESSESVTAFGCSGFVSVWHPFLETVDADHTIVQCALQNEQNDTVQSIEAGWTVDPGLNGDYAPHLFVYYTTNDYSGNDDHVGGYNQMVDGWIQVDPGIMPGASFTNASQQGQPPVGFEMEFQLVNGNWWLSIQDRMIGYYPGTLFNPDPKPFQSLAAFAQRVSFYGEVATGVRPAKLTRTQMGSGRRAETGFAHACLVCNLLYRNFDGSTTDHNGTVYVEDADLFNLDPHMLSGGDFGSYFYAGGAMPSSPGSLDGYVTLDRAQHVNFLTDNGDVHELVYQNSNWWHHNLSDNAQPGVAAARGSLHGYVSLNGDQHVVFIGTDGNVYELLYQEGNWKTNRLSEKAGAPPAAAGAITGYVTSNGDQHVNFIGLDRNVYELLYQNNRWQVNKLRQSADRPAAADGSLDGYITPGDDQHVNFIDRKTREVHELLFQDGHWKDNNLFLLAGGAPASADNSLHAYVTDDGDQHVNYIAQTGHVFELLFQDGRWRANNLSQLAKPPVTVSALPGALTGYVTGNGDQHVNFLSAGGLVHELLFQNGHWRHNMLSVLAGGATAVTGALDGYVTFDQAQHVPFIGSEGHLHELIFRNGGWQNNDLS